MAPAGAWSGAWPGRRRTRSRSGSCGGRRCCRPGSRRCARKMSADGPPVWLVSNGEAPPLPEPPRGVGRPCRCRRVARGHPAGPRGGPCWFHVSVVSFGRAVLCRSRVRVDHAQLARWSVAGRDVAAVDDAVRLDGMAAIATAVPAPSTTTAGNASLRVGSWSWDLRWMACRLAPAATGASTGSTSTRAEWKAPPPPRSVSSCGRQRVGHGAARAARGPPARGQRDDPGPDDLAEPGPREHLAARVATRTTSPSAMPRGAASSG